ncbi:tetratricopeptide repeat protein [Mucilaginibacter sp. UYCu711]|uniref:tetratricopeptide repeat protein n=1 Tax=Mucilaginibacter sp. UYCu711 TaxID=3156339 RepID=UPI003D197A07
MKYLSISLVFLVIFATESRAQETRKTDDALLLEYYQNQRFAEALSYLKSIYTEPVTDAKELTRLAYTAAMAKLLPDAADYYQRVYDRDSTNQSVLYNLANINQRRGNNNKAEFYFKKLVVLDTLNFNAYNRLGQINRDKADLKNEVYYFEKANKLNPTDADVAVDLTEAYIIQDQDQKAEKILAIAINADPDHIILQQTLLRLSYVQSKWKETVKTGEQLLLLGDSTAATMAKLGRAYFQTKSYDCGIATLLKIPDDNQTENTAYYTAGCYKMLKDQKKAILYFNKAITLSISTSTGTYYNEIADSYETQKSFKKAKDNYLKGLLYDEQPIAYYYLATMFDSELKDKKSALKYYKKYVGAKPDEKQKKYKDFSVARIATLSVH